MATLMVRDIDDAQYARLAQAAKAQGRSLAAEVRAMLDERDRLARQKQVVDEFLADVTANPIKLPEGMTSLDLLREERDSW